MPVIWHQCESEQFDRVFLEPFIEDSYERLVVSRFFEDRLAVISSIQSVVDHACFVGSFLTRHRISNQSLSCGLTEEYHADIRKTTPVTFFLPVSAISL